MALKRTLRTEKPPPREDEDPVARAILPYVSTVSGKISRILKKHNIRTIHRPTTKLRQLLVNPKDPVGLKTPGVYSVPCECGKMYIGETGRTIETRMKEHLRHFRLGQLEKSAVAEHSILENHCIHWEEAGILCRSHGYWDRIIKEAIQIKTHPENFNRDQGFRLQKCWDVLLRRKGGGVERKKESSRQ
jgi:predicted GIY-YIG superfamily endonuclease